MNFANLSSVVFGDKEAMKDFLFENSLQHTLFRDTLIANGANPPGYPITDVDFDNFDDWLPPGTRSAKPRRATSAAHAQSSPG